jgi:hypothetical protein
LLDRLHGLTEEIEVKLLKLGTRKRLGEVISVLEGFDLKASRLLGRKGALRLFYFALKLAQCTKVGRDVCAGLLLVLLDKVFNHAVIEIFTTEVGITSSSQDLKDTIDDREKRNVECATSEVIDNDPGFGLGLLVKAVGDGSGCGFIDDTENLQAGDSSCVFCCLALGVVEVCSGVSRGILPTIAMKNALAGTVTMACVTFFPR